MMYLEELLLRRRSIRRFTDEPITVEEKTKLIHAGLVAPSSKNSRPWNFIVIEDKEIIEKLSKCKMIGAMPLETASWAIVVAADTRSSDVWIEDASIAASYVQLQAEELGIGSCWVQIRGRMFDGETTSSEYVKELLELPAELEVVCILALGRKGEQRKPYNPEKMQHDKVFINKWHDRQQGPHNETPSDKK